MKIEPEEFTDDHMIQIIQDAAIDMGRSGAREGEKTGKIFKEMAVTLHRIAASAEADRHGFPHIVLRGAFDTAVAWMEATALTLTDEIMEMGK